MSDRLQKILETVSDQDKVELNLAQHGRNQTMIAYRDRPGKDTRADMEAAREQLQDTIDRLWRSYFPEDAPAPEGERFKNRKQALGWLQAQGKISMGAWYGYCDAGEYVNKLGIKFPLTVQPDKTISKFQVLQFAVEYFGQQPVKDTDDETIKADRRKRIAEAEIAERKNEREKRDMDNDWLERPKAIKQMAALLGNSRSAVLRRMHKSYPEIIRKCGGDQSRGNEVYEFLRSIVLEGFNDVCHAGRVEGTLVKETANAPSAE